MVCRTVISKLTWSTLATRRSFGIIYCEDECVLFVVDASSHTWSPSFSHSMAVFVPVSIRSFSLHGWSTNDLPTLSLGALRLWATKGCLKFGFGAALLLFRVANLGSKRTAVVTSNTNRHTRSPNDIGNGLVALPWIFHVPLHVLLFSTQNVKQISFIVNPKKTINCTALRAVKL